MEVGAAKNIYPSQIKKGKVGEKNKYNRKKYSFSKSAFHLTVP